jgi:predicted Fe-Mo cluster-binding NifX family protein
MKIAITSTGESMDSKIDPRFGRCAFFAIHDTEKNVTEFFVNPAKDSLEGAGPAAVQFVAGYKVEKIVSGEFGMKIKPIVESLHIEMVTNMDETSKIADIISLYRD